jgi:thimet oligopeptidase
MAAAKRARLTKPSLMFLSSPEALARKSEADLAKAQRLLDRLLRVDETRTVENTFIPFNEISRVVSEVALQGQLLFNVHPAAAMRDAANKAYLAAESFETALSLNRPLYEAFAALDPSKEDEETRFGISKILRDFRRAGVDQDEATRTTIKALNDEISEIGSTFDRNINEDVRSITIDGAGDLAGLPPDFISAHTHGGDPITITTTYPDAIPVFQYAVKEDLRHRLRRAFDDRGFPKNLEILDKLLQKRHELARLLGYPDYATYVTEDKMIGSAQAAEEFVGKVSSAADERTGRDYALILKRRRRDDPGAADLQPWDINYYTDRVRAEEYAFDSQAVRPYFAFEKVRDGILAITGDLFGLRYKRVADAPVWHPSVEAYDVFDGRRRLGRFYLDLHPREGKYSHAAMFGLVIGLRDIQLPQAALVCNFPDPKTAAPALMEHTDVVTFFHEFGHLLHAILSGRSRWIRTSMEGIEWDFVEAPSQMLEEWARRPEALQRFAKHYQTGEALAQDLIDRMERASAVARGLWVRRQIYLAALSLAYYRRDPAGLDTTALAKELNRAYYPVPWHEGTHFQCNFGHLNGYSAVYYTYMWSLVIAKDLFRRFLESPSIFDRGIAQRYRRAVLEAASVRSAATMVREFLGRDVSFEAFQAWLDEGAA